MFWEAGAVESGGGAFDACAFDPQHATTRASAVVRAPSLRIGCFDVNVADTVTSIDSSRAAGQRLLLLEVYSRPLGRESKDSGARVSAPEPRTPQACRPVPSHPVNPGSRLGMIALASVSALVGVGASAAPAAAAHASVARPATCDVLDPVECLYPFPDDYFTVPDAATATGRRLDFQVVTMPRNAEGTPIDPTAWNRSDGFSPGAAILTFVPGLDLAQTGAAPLTDIGSSLRADAPIVLLDATTGRRVPYWAELDATAPSDAMRSLIVHPAVDFGEGHHIVVALRDLRDPRGAFIPPGPAFRAIRDGVPTVDPAVEARRARLDQVLATLQHAGVTRHSLYLAWDFTVASARSLAGPMLHMRDDAFASLDGRAPRFRVTNVADNPSAAVARMVTGTFTVPSYLSGDGGPGSRLVLGRDGLPRRTGSLNVPFECIVPHAALSAAGVVHPARPAMYGHGLLGTEAEVTAPDVQALAEEHDVVLCATRWLGLAADDVPNIVEAAQNASQFPSIPDRTEQGMLDTLLLGRLMINADGLRTDPAFRSASGVPTFDARGLFYDGNSLGGILGGATTAIAQDWTRAVLGVPGMNFSLLLPRSVDYDPYQTLSEQAYPNPIDRTLIVNLLQIVWDRGDANGYAQHLTADPYSNTPAHTVLLHEAFGDQQVANVATEVEARTIGAHAYRPALDPGRSLDPTPLWGIPTLDARSAGGSALIVWDSGSPAPPPVNLPPRAGLDPHEDPRASPAARDQISAFLEAHGRVVDVCHGQPCHAAPAPAGTGSASG
jgi:hypothetical protein